MSRPVPDRARRLLESGRRIGRYEVEHLIGQGGMAQVYRVRHTVLGSLHALKVLERRSDTVLERLLREGKAQAQLRHTHVLRVDDVFELDGLPALLLEYADGGDLGEWLVHEYSGLDDALAIFRGAVEGMQWAHARGFVHRDLKPSNVLLSGDGQRDRVAKVADFGIVKVLDPMQGDALTRTRATMGTPAYMAPEQWGNARAVDQRADVWALGCILYAVACRRPPFEQTALAPLLDAVRSQQYTDPRQHVPSLPDAVRTAILGCLQADPDRRIPDCATLLAVLDGQPFSVSAEARPSPAPLAPLHTLVPELSDLASAPTQVPADDTFDLDVPPPPPARRLPIAIGAAAVFLLAAGWWAITPRSPDVPPISPPELAAGSPPPAPAEPPPAPPSEVEPRDVPAEVEPAPATAAPRPTAQRPPEPEPPPPEAEPAPPEPEPAEPETPPPPSSWSVKGGHAVALQSKSTRRIHRPGKLPAGRYDIVWTANGSDAGDVIVAEGVAIEVDCNPILRTCSGASR